MVWNDEFDHFDNTKWKVWNQGGGFGNNELQFYRDHDDNRFIRDGKLVLKSEKKGYGGHNYVSAKLNSHMHWKYGWFKVNFKKKLTKNTWRTHPNL